MIGTLESVQSLQVQNGHLQKAREGYYSKCIELERLRKEGVPQKELEKVFVWEDIKEGRKKFILSLFAHPHVIVNLKNDTKAQ